MKRIIIIITVTVLFIAAGVGAWFADMHREAMLNNTTTCERYALTTCVVEVDRDNDIVTCEDSNGNLWEFYGCEDWQEGDCASLLMNDQGTPSVYDDAIEGARYSAWTLTR